MQPYCQHILVEVTDSVSTDRIAVSLCLQIERSFGLLLCCRPACVGNSAVYSASPCGAPCHLTLWYPRMHVKTGINSVGNTLTGALLCNQAVLVPLGPGECRRC